MSDILTPGFVYGMPDEEYHTDPVPGGSLSSTFARLLTNHVPAKARAIRANRQPTKAMNLGKAAHREALGAGPELVTWQHDGRTKEGKAERAAMSFLIETEAAVAVTEKERAQIKGMAEALLRENHIAEILDMCEPEVSAFWQEGGVWCRARYDLLFNSGSWDYKTTLDASERGFSKAMGSWGYHQQADFYQRGLRALGHPAAEYPLEFICQETTPPYLVQIHRPDEFAMEAARLLNDKVLDIFAECMETGIWPGFPNLIAEPVSLPAWYLYQHGEDIGFAVEDVVI